MSEAAFKFEFQRVLLKVFPSAQIDNIESPIHAPGFPDTEICVNGKICNIEFKYSANARAPHIRGTQVTWFKNRIIAGGTPWALASIVIEDMPRCILVDGIHLRELAYTTDGLKWKELSTCNFKIDEMEIKHWRKVINHIIGAKNE